MFSRYNEDDDDKPQQSGSGTYKIPDRDFYRKNFNAFGSVYECFQSSLYERSFKERRLLQPHYNALIKVRSPFGNKGNPGDGVCSHFLRRGFTKPNKVNLNAAVWSADARWLVLGTQTGDLALWESEALKVHKVISIPAHKEFYGDGSDRIKEQIPITAMCWKHHGNVLATGDSRGVIQYCDETFRNIFVTKDAHVGAVRGLSFSPFDAKLVSCSDDAKVNVWSVGRDKPDCVLQGHQSDIKSSEWHPYRSLIVTGSRDCSIKLWDPRMGQCVSIHKKQVNSCLWNANGNWFASGATDGMVKVFDIRTMRDFESWRGHNSEVCKLGWHPLHETLLVSGAYNGSLIYWMVGYSQSPHTIISDAHRQSIELITWHPYGHLLATASHDCILKFWCREPPGSRLELPASELAQDNPPQHFHGPLPLGAAVVNRPSTSVAAVPLPAGASSTNVSKKRVREY